MSVPGNLQGLCGNWAGSSRLWVHPKDPASESDSTASLALAAQGRFLTIRYTWSHEGKPQDGLLLLGADPQQEIVKAAWIDSWHNGHSIMLCEGRAAGGAVSIQGSYAAPPGPDWGWRIVIEPASAGSFRLGMYNVAPGGEEEIAVEAIYTRAG